MRTTIALFAALLLGLVGCGAKSSETAQQGESKPANSVVGKWRGKVKVAADPKDESAAKLAESMASMFGDFLLEIKDDNTFELSVLGMPTTGKVEIRGNAITLTPTHVMGKTVEEFRKQHKGDSNAGQPMSGTISADFAVISVKDENQPNNRLEFTRDTTKPREIGAETVTAEEKAWVGTYAAVLAPARLKPEDKDMANALIAKTKLELFHDNSFTMMMGMEVEGKWKMEKGNVVLTATKINGTEEKPGSSNKPIALVPKGKTLEPLPTDGNAPPFNFVRKD
jgi:hypothetical protein